MSGVGRSTEFRFPEGSRRRLGKWHTTVHCTLYMYVTLGCIKYDGTRCYGLSDTKYECKDGVVDVDVHVLPARHDDMSTVRGDPFSYANNECISYAVIYCNSISIAILILVLSVSVEIAISDIGGGRL